MISLEKPTGLDCMINSYKKQEKQDIKFISTRNKSIISMDAVLKWFNIQSRIINDTIPIIAKLVLSLGFYFYWQMRFQNLKIK